MKIIYLIYYFHLINHPFLNSLLDQSIRVNKIVLNLPDSYENKEYDVPSKYNDIILVYRSGKNYGKYNHIIPVLLRELEDDTIIISLKDNYIYNYYLIENLLNKYEQNPDNIIYDNNLMLFKPKFFNKNIVNYNKDENDDNWINKHANVKQIFFKQYEKDFNYL